MLIVIVFFLRPALRRCSRSSTWRTRSSGARSGRGGRTKKNAVKSSDYARSASFTAAIAFFSLPLMLMLPVFVGPSGCGKSMFLRVVAELQAATEGEVRTGQRRENEATPAFQNLALYPH